MLSDKVYNVLKITAQYVLPATASLYFGLSKIWVLPYPDQVVGTIMAVDAFLGAILGLSLVQYKKTLNNGFVQPPMPGLEEAKSKSIFAMSGKTYNILYWVVQVVLPSIATLYFALSGFWILPYTEQVVATIVLVDTFMGVFLGISTNQYNKAKQEISA